MRDVQYVGPVTRYHVALDRGGELQALAQNLEETSGEVLASEGAPRAARSGGPSRSRKSSNGRETG